MKVALSIAGSDSGAGAGIQADLKTFMNLGIYGCTAITAVTAQNTLEISGIFEVSAESLAKQISSVILDMPPDAVKIGMVYNKSNIHTIRNLLKRYDTPIIVDPILIAGIGAKLLLPDSFESFKEEIIPLSTVITPNRIEAQMITGYKIISRSDVTKAAKKILKLGARNVVIKGNRFQRRVVTDVLFTSEGRSIEVSNPKLNIDDVHGSGCTFSAAYTAFLARDFSIIDSFKLANKYVRDTLQNALKIGNGHLVSNPAGFIYDCASRYVVLNALRSAVEDIQAYKNFGILIPETQSNVVFALADARELNDIAGIRGRLIKIGNTVRSASSIVEFGASKHVGSALLAYMTVNRLIRSAMNIKYDEKIKKIVKTLFKVSNYDRRKEPINVMTKEGSSILWGIKFALAKNQEAEVIYHEGSVGKEPMCIVFAKDPRELLSKIRIILKNYE